MKTTRPPALRPDESDSIRGDYHDGFATMDHDHDGYLDRAEINAHTAAEFDASDLSTAGA